MSVSLESWPVVIVAILIGFGVTLVVAILLDRE